MFCPLFCSSTAYLGRGSKDIPEGRPVFSPAASSSWRAAPGLDGRCNRCSLSSVYLKVSPPGWTHLKLLPRELKRRPNHMLKLPQPARLGAEERSLCSPFINQLFIEKYAKSYPNRLGYERQSGFISRPSHDFHKFTVSVYKWVSCVS